MLILTFIILVIIAFAIIRSRDTDGNGTAGNIAIAAIFIVISLFVIRANMSYTETTEFTFKLTSNIEHGCSDTGTKLNFFTDHNNALVSVMKRNVDIFKSNKDYSYIVVEADRGRWRPYIKKLESFDENVPKEFWVWPFEYDKSTKSYSWSWDNRLNKLNLYIKQ